jgi:hypothetical protein
LQSGLQGAGGVAGQDAVGHLSGGHLRCAAREAVDTARPADLLCARPPVGEKAAKFYTPNQGRALIVDGLQALSKPSANGVLVNGEETGNLFD